MSERKREEGPEIVIAKRAGFCFGVKRAMDIAFDRAREAKGGVSTLGPIIHNPQVIEALKRQGIHPVDIGDIDDQAISALIIRTHGIPREIYDSISSRGIRIIDATCPFVKKAQHYAQLLQEKGYQVIILGDRNHPEVKGLMSYAGDDAVVVDKDGPLPVLRRKVGIVVQTTQPLDALTRLLARVVRHAREIKVYNTICSSTALRQKETEEMARKVDAMIVVGGRNSANTTQLAQLCESLGVKTYHIETESEIDDAWLRDVRKVGITAGASTPDWIIERVAERIRDRGGEPRNGT